MTYYTLRKLITAVVLSGLFSIPIVSAHIPDNLPNIGTAGAGTLTIAQEIEMGDYYLRSLRSGAPFINDPLLNDYLNDLGNKLARHSGWTQTPFHFFLIRNSQINAFAFFGGNVVIHTGLLRDTDTESQLASVFAHEISHITQRHLASALENQRRSAPLTWAGTVGSILLAMANPQAGMAALTSTLAGTQQNLISFTQSNEREADRLGLRLLQRAGLDPQGSPQFLQKLADQARYSSKPPEMLLTHPLPESRLNDARNRASQMGKSSYRSSLDYFLAKVRSQILESNNNSVLDVLLSDYAKGNERQKIAAQYGAAFQDLQQNNLKQAEVKIESLLSQQPDNIWFLDLSTDIDIANNKATQAIRRLESALKHNQNNRVLQLNLANAYISANQLTQATTLLHRYTHNSPNDPNGWVLLAESYSKQRLRAEELSARAELSALTGDFSQAISLLSDASAASKLGSANQARFDARIDQLRNLQQKYQQFQK